MSTLPSVELFYADVNLPAATRAAGLKVRPQPSTSATEIGYWPHGRCGVVKAISNSTWYECRYRGQVGYVMAQYLENFRPAHALYPQINADTPNRLKEVAVQEAAAEHDSHVKFYCYGMNDYDANGNRTQWCHMYADWLSAHCYWGASYATVFPMIHNCKDGVRWFLQRDSFKFINGTYKANIYNNIPDMRDLVTSPSLTTAESNYYAYEGDYVYFYNESKPNEVSAHVAVVVGITSSFNPATGTTQNTSITIGEGNVANHQTRCRTIQKSQFVTEHILGFGRPAGYFYG